MEVECTQVLYNGNYREKRTAYTCHIVLQTKTADKKHTVSKLIVRLGLRHV